MLFAFALGALVALGFILEIRAERKLRREIFTIASRLADRNQQLELLNLRLRQELTDRPQVFWSEDLGE